MQLEQEPTSTYRLQLNPSFGFAEAKALLDYFKRLGISHLYLSPCLQPVSGSTHGYDVVDPGRINTELGGEKGFQELCQAAQAAGLGIMVDLVPNHMAIHGQENPWWWDVLENGPSSPYALFFDVDWDASEERWPNKVLLPVLQDHYGRVLENGALQLVYQEGRIVLRYEDQTFPLDPSSLSGIYSKVADALHSELLAFIADSYARLPRPTVTARKLVERRSRDKAVLFQMLLNLCQQEPDLNMALSAEITRINIHPDILDALLDQQNYRLAYWRTVSRDLGYRRFFDIKDLVGLKIEELEVFHATHALPISWFLNGWVQGLRIDHPDGLRDPTEYFARLQEACPGAWVIAEKILMHGESLPTSWKVAGTTGYDFLNLVQGLHLDPKAQESLTKIYEEMIGPHPDFNEQMYLSKYQVLINLFGSEVSRLLNLLTEICEKHRRYRDYTRPQLRETLCQIAACFPVYRSYISVSRKSVSAEDEKNVVAAISLAKTKKPDLDPDLLHFLQELLLLRIEGVQEGEFAMRFQHLTSPVMAKGLEDTALYRYCRFIALNEVGGDPACLGISVANFHTRCQTALEQHPFSLLASSTHDTKRSEDVRARLCLLSEMPEQFGAAVQRWSKINEHLRQNDLPDKNSEYLFYQTLLGAFPISVERVLAYMQKALREAKVHTCWTSPNQEFEQIVAHFIQEALHNEAFYRDVENFVTPLMIPGQLVSLAQTLIKLTAPGVPDIYQGSELWNLTLVDPDNRQPVDFTQRLRLMDEMQAMPLESIVGRMTEGLPKLWLIQKMLQFRQQHRGLFGSAGSYTPLLAKGSKAAHAVAFLRGEQTITLTPRLVMQLNNNWEDTTLDLPSGLWKNLFTGEEFSGKNIAIQKLLARFPVAFLLKDNKDHKDY